MADWMQDTYSSNLKQVGYDGATGETIVVFRKSGKIAAYPNTTEEQARQLANASSAGTLFNQEFKHLPFRYI